MKNAIQVLDVSIFNWGKKAIRRSESYMVKKAFSIFT